MHRLEPLRTADYVTRGHAVGIGRVDVTVHPLKRALFGLCLIACLGLTVAPAGATNVHYPFGPGYRHCGQLGKSSIYVSADGFTCTHARRIIREFRLGPPGRVHHHGPENYNGWWTLERYPGWRCQEGTGGGACEMASQQAAFSTL